MKVDADYWKGFMAGRAIAVRLAELGMVEYDWYLYNGVRLPKLPEWDRQTYPYAYIQYGSTSEGDRVYALVLSTVKFTTRKWAIVVDALVGTADGDAIRWRYNLTTDVEWSRTDKVYSVVAGEDVGVHMGPLVWVNTDIYSYTSGTLYLAASEPIPTT